jgi:hypothetical protein
MAPRREALTGFADHPAQHRARPGLPHAATPRAAPRTRGTDRVRLQRPRRSAPPGAQLTAAAQHPGALFGDSTAQRRSGRKAGPCQAAVGDLAPCGSATGDR